jgi:hypothetical protein
VLFNISTFAALNHHLSTHQVNDRVWAPDAFGSIPFLVSSGLALAEVCHRWVCVRRRSLSWWIVAIKPAWLDRVRGVGDRVADRAVGGRARQRANRDAGTSVGGVCFLVAALMLIPEAAKARRGHLQSTPQAGATQLC